MKKGEKFSGKKVKKASSKAEAKPKKKRKLSAYNKFVKKQMDKGMSMAEAADAWKDHKAGLPPKKTAKKTARIARRNQDIEDALIRNMIELQKINVNMAQKFDNLTKEISHLLALFESTAHTFAKTAPLGEFEKDKEFLTKIDRLLDQNKVLAKGLTLMEDRLRERVYGDASPYQLTPESKPSPEPTVPAAKRPLPKF